MYEAIFTNNSRKILTNNSEEIRRAQYDIRQTVWATNDPQQEQLTDSVLSVQ